MVTPASAEVLPPVDRDIIVNGLRIHYLDWGTRGKPPLLLLHGIARTAHNYDHLAPHFVSDYHVIAVDMRGHGDSDWHPEGAYLVEDYVKDIEALVVQLQLRDIVLWGSSTGGRVAQVFAGTHPELVAAVIVEDVGPERPKEVSEGRASRMVTEENGWASEDELVVHTKVRHPLTPDATLRNFVRHGSKRRADGRIVWKRDPAITRGFIPTELWRFIRRIKAPITYILGGTSKIVPPQTQEELKRILPQVQITSMSGLGHYPSDESPAEFLAVADRFLRSGNPERTGNSA